MDPTKNQVPEVDGRSARILIVDDDPKSRQLLQVMLDPEGFELQTAAGAEEALAIVAKQPPDLILLDVTMPGMDGYAVATKIKGNLAIHAIPIILVTALDSRNARMLGLGAGADDFLSKPVNRAELCVRVRSLLRMAYRDGRAPHSTVQQEQVEVPRDPEPLATSGPGQESARLIDDLSGPWQEAVLEMVRAVHGQVAVERARAKERDR